MTTELSRKKFSRELINLGRSIIKDHTGNEGNGLKALTQGLALQNPQHEKGKDLGVPDPNGWKTKTTVELYK